MSEQLVYVVVELNPEDIIGKECSEVEYFSERFDTNVEDNCFYDCCEHHYISSIRYDLLPEGFLTRIINTNYDKYGKYILYLKDSNFVDVLEYIRCPDIIVEDETLAKTLNYYGLYHMNNYTEIYAREKFMRSNMYDDRFSTHPMNTNPYYNLIKYSEIDNIPSMYDDDENYLFRQGHIKGYDINRKDFTYISKELSEYNCIFKGVDNLDHIYIAGGNVLNNMMGIKVNSSDLDIFLVDCDKEMADNIIMQILSNDYTYSPSRSKNCISCIYDFGRSMKVQIILRLYKSLSEVLHGFDVDCCCLGYEVSTGDIYLTERALYSHIYSINTINFDLLSPSYEYRLTKYARRGFSVYIPDFDRSKVSMKNVNKHVKLKYEMNTLRDNILTCYEMYRDAQYDEDDMIDNLSKTIKTAMNEYYYLLGVKKYNNKYRGLDLLLILEMATLKSLHSYIASDEISDYYDIHNHKTKLDQLFRKYHIPCMHRYMDIHVKYTTYRNDINIVEILYINNDVERLFEMDNDMYNMLSFIGCDIPSSLEYKIVNPGEQFTGSFNKIVLSNNSYWYGNPRISPRMYMNDDFNMREIKIIPVVDTKVFSSIHLDDDN